MNYCSGSVYGICPDTSTFAYMVIWKVVFSNKFVLLGQIFTKTHKLIKCMSNKCRDVIFAEKKKSPCGRAPQHRTGLVKLTISLLVSAIGDYLVRTNW